MKRNLVFIVGLIFMMSTTAFGDSHNDTSKLKRRIERRAGRILEGIRNSRADPRSLNKAIELLEGAENLISRQAPRGNNNSPSPSPSPSPNACAVIYQHDSFRGRALAMQPGKDIGDLHRVGFGDFASSAKVSGGCRLTLFQHNRFRGFSEAYVSGAYANLARMNDEGSSAQCNCRRRRRP